MSHTIVIALQKTVDALVDMTRAHESMCDKVDKLEGLLCGTTKHLNREICKLEATDDELDCLKSELMRTKRGREILAQHEGCK